MLKPTLASPEKRHWVRLTRACNQRCLFCLDRAAQGGGFLPMSALRDELVLGRREKTTRVVLSGGEPSLHPRFIEIVALSRKTGYTHIQVITNGRRFCYGDFLRRAVAEGLTEITFSLHGHTAALHDGLTRVPGAFVQAMTALKHALGTPGLIVSVDVVISRPNLRHLREILEFFISRGVREFDLLALVPFSDAWAHWERLYCDFEDPRNLSQLRRALELSRRPELHLWTNRLRAEFLEGFEGLIQSPGKIKDEVRGRREIFEDLLRRGLRLPCEGEGCRYCFLKGFCGDLGELLKGGKLPSKKGPLCLREAAVPPEEFAFGPEPDIDDYADFYTRARYFAKGTPCKGCLRRGECDGMSVELVRQRGFGALVPGAREAAWRS